MEVSVSVNHAHVQCAMLYKIKYGELSLGLVKKCNLVQVDNLMATSQYIPSPIQGEKSKGHGLLEVNKKNGENNHISWDLGC